MATTVVTARGRIRLPAKLRRQDGVEAGQVFEVERIDRGEYRLTRKDPRPNEGLVDWLLACPEKGWFAPIAGESTDSLQGSPVVPDAARRRRTVRRRGRA